MASEHGKNDLSARRQRGTIEQRTYIILSPDVSKGFHDAQTIAVGRHMSSVFLSHCLSWQPTQINARTPFDRWGEGCALCALKF